MAQWLCESVAALPAGVSADALLASLSPEERARGARLVRPETRDRWLLGRGLLREALGRLVGAAGRDLRFALSEEGKPRLAWPEVDGGFEFSLSHSADRVLIAWSGGGAPASPIGADLERVDPGFDWRSVARRALVASEVAALEALGSPEEQARGFYRIWSLKEAALKARGVGVAELASCRELADLRAGSIEALPGIWARAIDAAPGFAAAIAAPGLGWRARRIRWAELGLVSR